MPGTNLGAGDALTHVIFTRVRSGKTYHQSQLLYRWGHRGTERFSKLPKATQLVRRGARIQTHKPGPLTQVSVKPDLLKYLKLSNMPQILPWGTRFQVWGQGESKGSCPSTHHTGKLGAGRTRHQQRQEELAARSWLDGWPPTQRGLDDTFPFIAPPKPQLRACVCSLPKASPADGGTGDTITAARGRQNVDHTLLTVIVTGALGTLPSWAFTPWRATLALRSFSLGFTTC